MPSVRARPWGVRVGQVKPRQKIGIDLQIVIQTQRAAYWVARGASDNRAFLSCLVRVAKTVVFIAGKWAARNAFQDRKRG
jgi:hypothetical protein